MQAVHKIVVGRGVLEQPGLLRPNAQLVLVLVVLLLAGQQRRKRLADELAQLPQLVAHQPGREVVAGNHAPQPALVNQGNGHGGRRAHVAQVLQVHRRHAAQHRVGHVGWAVGYRVVHRHQRHGRVGCVGDEAQPVFEVHGPRLLRHVRGRVVQPQPGRQVLADGLGNDFAALVGRKPVNGHPVEARDGAHLLHGVLAKLLHLAGGQHLAQGGVQEGEVEGRGVGFGHRLKLQPQQLVVAVQNNLVKRLPRHGVQPRPQQRGRVGEPFQQALDFGQPVRPQQLVEPAVQQAFGRPANQGVGVGAGLHNAPGGRVQAQQKAVGLNGPRDVNRLPVAVGEGDGHVEHRHVGQAHG